MAAKIEIPLSINPRDLIRGLKVSEDAVDDLADELTKIEDAGDQAEQAFDSLADSARRDLRKVGDAADRAERDVDDLTDEVGDSAREFGSAFRGDPVEALEEVQSLASELASRFIPGIGGAVVAVTGGIAFSALIGFYERWKEEQEAINERVRGFRDEILDALGVITKGQLADAILEQLDRAGVGAQEFEDLLAAAPKSLGDGFRQALQSGDLQAMDDIAGDIADAADLINRRFVAQGSALTPGQQAVLDLNRALGGSTGEIQDAIGEAQAWARTIGSDVVGAANEADRALSFAARGRQSRISVSVVGASSKAQNLLDRGVL